MKFLSLFLVLVTLIAMTYAIPTVAMEKRDGPQIALPESGEAAGKLAAALGLQPAK
ncbi:hypothetical protein GGI17_002310 [Coemansia sp. S146]|nr:hypothetical protein GGI17_002310 [Coemansia sp. S146]